MYQFPVYLSLVNENTTIYYSLPITEMVEPKKLNFSNPHVFISPPETGCKVESPLFNRAW